MNDVEKGEGSVPRKPLIVHAQYWAVHDYFGQTVVTNEQAIEAWESGAHRIGTLEFGFRIWFESGEQRFIVGTTYTPITSYPLTPAAATFAAEVAR